MELPQEKGKQCAGLQDFLRKDSKYIL